MGGDGAPPTSPLEIGRTPIRLQNMLAVKAPTGLWSALTWLLQVRDSAQPRVLVVVEE